MITGFNTDIEHEGVIYHVQTEDKGVSTPLILSLVYNRGTILASKRSPYDDLLLPAFDEKALSERLQKQHKLICAAVRAGRIEDLKRMTRDSASAKSKKVVAQAEVNSRIETKEFLQPKKIAVPQTPEKEVQNRKISSPVERIPPAHQQVKSGKIPVEIQAKEVALDLPEAPPITSPSENKIETKTAEIKKDSALDFPMRFDDEELIIEAVEIIEEEIILSAEAVEIVSDFNEVNQISDGKLKIDLPDDLIFRSGERKTVSILVYRGSAQNGLAGAHIMIKVFGAAFRPLIFHAKTDKSGAASVHLQMPQFKGGRAAVLIKAMSDGEETELRRVIEQN